MDCAELGAANIDVSTQADMAAAIRRRDEAANMPNSPLPDINSREPAPLSADKTTVGATAIGRRAGTGKVLFEVCSVSLG